MPWKECHVMDERLRFVARLLEGEMRCTGPVRGGWYTDSYISPAFKARLEQRYPGVRLVTHMMPYAYDSYRMLVDAFESGDALSYFRVIRRSLPRSTCKIFLRR